MKMRQKKKNLKIFVANFNQLRFGCRCIEFMGGLCQRRKEVNQISNDWQHTNMLPNKYYSIDKIHIEYQHTGQNYDRNTERNDTKRNAMDKCHISTSSKCEKDERESMWKTCAELSFFFCLFSLPPPRL